MRLLSVSFQHTVRNPQLLAFGVLIAMLDGQCIRLGAAVSFDEQRRDDLFRTLGNLQGDSVIAAASLLVVAISSYWLLATLAGNWALGALIAGVDSAHGAERVDLRTAVRVGIERFWSLSMLGLLNSLPIVLLLGIDAAFGLAALFTRSVVLETVLLVWLPMALLLGVLVSIVGAIAQVDAVLSDRGPVQGIMHALQLLRRSPWRLGGSWLLINAVGSIFVVVTAGLVGFLVVPWCIAGGPAECIAACVVLALVSLVAGFGVVLHRALWVAVYRDLCVDAPSTPSDLPS